MEAVVFDMDGVVVDSEAHWLAVENEYFSRRLPSWDPRDHHRFLGLSVESVYALLSREFGLRISWPEFQADYMGIAERIYARDCRLLPGFERFLGTLRSKGLPVALASSAPRAWIDRVLDRFALRPAFGCVVSADDLHGKGKPAPDIFLLAARGLSVAPGRCLAIEDAANGVQSAKAAGMRCLALRNGVNDDQDLRSADMEARGFDAISFERLLALFPTPAA